MIKIKLKKLIEITDGTLLNKLDKNYTIKNITTNSNDILPDSVFVAFKGEKFDGHDFIIDAIEGGAKAIILSDEKKQPQASADFIKVEDTLIAYQKIANFKRNYKKYIVVGITGSVGKTSTRQMIDCAINNLIDTHSTKKNFNNEIGVPKTILEADDDAKVCLLEMGMRGLGEISVLSKIANPDIAVITNIGMSHIERLKTKENIFKAKSEILDGLRGDGVLIVNGDDEKLANLIYDNFGKYYTVAVTTKPDLKLRANLIFAADNIKQLQDCLSFDLTVTPIEGKEYRVDDIRLNTVGVHNITNALLALAVATELDLNLESVCKNISNYSVVDNRQKIIEFKNFTLIDDTYNSSPESSEASIKMLSALSSARKIAVLAGMLELGDYTHQEHILLGKKCVKEGIDLVLTYDEFGAIISEGINMLNGNTNTKTINFSDKSALFEFLKGEIKSGDTLLIKGSRGFAMEDVVNSLSEEYAQKK